MKKIVKKILRYFLRGLLIFVPIALTVSILVYVFTGLDDLLRELFKIPFPGLGLLVTIGGIFLIGLLASNFLGGRLFGLVDKLFKAVPLVKMLYGAIRDLVEAFAGEKKKFDKPVLVTLGPGLDAKVLGFITRETLEHLGLEDHVAVYFPQSYNFAGNVVIFPKKAVKRLNIESAEAMTFIVSGGVAGEHARIAE